MRKRVDDWEVHIFREYNSADVWTDKGVKGRQGRMGGRLEKSYGPRSLDCVGSRMGVVVTAYAVQVC